jgi:hypothetical protein
MHEEQQQSAPVAQEITKEEKHETEKQQAIAKATATRTLGIAGKIRAGGLRPASFDEMWDMALTFHRTGLMPSSLDTPQKVFLGLEMCMELGIPLALGVQNVAVINGRATIYGDLFLAIVLSHESCKDVIETPIQKDGKIIGYRCVAKRHGREDKVREFTFDDAKEAQLLPGKDRSAWSKYPQRMCMFRARSWACRDQFADVLLGLDIRETAQEEPGFGENLESVISGHESATKANDLRDRLAAYTDPQIQEIAPEEPESPSDEPENEDAPSQPEDIEIDSSPQSSSGTAIEDGPLPWEPENGKDRPAWVKAFMQTKDRAIHSMSKAASNGKFSADQIDQTWRELVMSSLGPHETVHDVPPKDGSTVVNSIRSKLKELEEKILR